jgi:hypothetical protein
MVVKCPGVKKLGQFLGGLVSGELVSVAKPLIISDLDGERQAQIALAQFHL